IKFKCIWILASDDDLDKDTLLGSKLTDNINDLLVNREDIVKDQ
ncbi:28274_t:CDS:1, partial [Dentiscutata erythropus]